MTEDLTIKITGEAGQGLQTIGHALNKAFQRSGFYVFADQDYMSRVRGGNNFFRIRVSTRPVFAPRKACDITICLDPESVRLQSDGASRQGIVVLDQKALGLEQLPPAGWNVPLESMAKEVGGASLFVNSAAFGLVAGLVRMELKTVDEVLRAIFGSKAAEVIDHNLAVARTAYTFAQEQWKDERFRLATGPAKATLLLNGNDGIGLGAIQAGCSFYSAYPMTPSTEVLNILAHHHRTFNIVVEQAEDELAAINMAIGASFAGARAMTGTAGGGFCLMTEGVSLAGMTETPLVVLVAQRPAPATGLPTRTEQADLNLVLYAGHGEFARVVFAPGTPEEAFHLTQRAFHLADKYQVTSFLLSDQHLGDSYFTLPDDCLKALPIERALLPKGTRAVDYHRYAQGEHGVSPRAVPGWIESPIYLDSDEHDESGHITESAEVRVRMVQKRLYQKHAALSEETVPPTVFQAQDADLLLVGFGSTYGMLRAMSEAFTARPKVGFVHLSQVWPLPPQVLATLQQAKRVFTVENNAGAQLAGLIRRETGFKPHGSILQYDGRPFDEETVRQQLERELRP